MYGRPVNEIINNVLERNPLCKSKEGIYNKYENCMENVTETTILTELNQNLKAKKESLGEEFTPVESDVEYCKEMFPSVDEFDSKIQCHVIIKKPLGPEQCFELKRVIDHEAYEFNRFYKYLCLY